jgi:hypothetical protein
MLFYSDTSFSFKHVKPAIFLLITTVFNNTSIKPTTISSGILFFCEIIYTWESVALFSMVHYNVIQLPEIASHSTPGSTGISIACQYDMLMSFRYPCLKTDIIFTLCLCNFFYIENLIYFRCQLHIYKIILCYVLNMTWNRYKNLCPQLDIVVRI